MSASGKKKQQQQQQQQQQPADGEHRAAEFNDAMLSVPGYADDSMLFIVRYGALAKNTLRTVDFNEFMTRVTVMNEHWIKSRCACSSGISTAITADPGATSSQQGSGDGSGAPSQIDPADPHDVEAAELKARSLEKIKEFPELVRDFDKFIACARLAGMRYNMK